MNYYRKAESIQTEYPPQEAQEIISESKELSSSIEEIPVEQIERQKPPDLPQQEPDKKKVAQQELIKLKTPKYFGTIKGQIINAMVNDNKHELTEIRKHLNLPENDFSKNFYEMLSDNDIYGNVQGHFYVNDKIAKEWLEYYNN